MGKSILAWITAMTFPPPPILEIAVRQIQSVSENWEEEKEVGVANQGWNSKSKSSWGPGFFLKKMVTLEGYIIVNCLRHP